MNKLEFLVVCKDQKQERACFKVFSAVIPARNARSAFPVSKMWDVDFSVEFIFAPKGCHVETRVKKQIVDVTKLDSYAEVAIEINKQITEYRNAKVSRAKSVVFSEVEIDLARPEPSHELKIGDIIVAETTANADIPAGNMLYYQVVAEGRQDTIGLIYRLVCLNTHHVMLSYNSDDLVELYKKVDNAKNVEIIDLIPASQILITRKPS